LCIYMYNGNWQSLLRIEVRQKGTD
jgi:hypothetical protein